MSAPVHGIAAAVLLAASALAPAARGAEPEAPTLVFAFEELVTLAPATSVGKTPYGERVIIPITGGTFEGPGLKGTIVPGSWDWQLRRTDGCTDVKADYMIRTDDGVTINVINTGALCPPQDGKAAPARTQPRFEAPIGKYDWLNRSAFIGTLDPVWQDGKVTAVRLRFYRAM